MGYNVMVTITLYKNIVFNNGCIMSNFPDYATQKSYFDNFQNKQSFTDVKFSKLTEPILIESDITNLFDYVYGSIDFGSDKRRIYFSISNFEVERENKTWIYYDIDYWETYRYPIDNGNGCKLSRANISRCSLDLGCRIVKPFTPQATKQKVLRMFQTLSEKHTKQVIFTYHSNSSNKNWIYIMQTSAEINDLIGFDFSRCSSGDNNNIDPSNIIGCWVDPFGGDWWTTKFNQVWTETVNSITRTLYRCEIGDFNAKSQSTITWVVDELTNYDPAKEQIGLTDLAGNLVWVSDGFHYDGALRFSLNITMTTARWFMYFQRDGVFTNGECRATIPCEPMDIFSDTFTSYAIQQRPFTEEQRLIQKNQSAVQGVANAGTSAIGGAVAGSMVAPGAGTVAGAVGGIVSSLVGTGVNYATTDYFNKQYQQNEDKQALVQTDNLRLEGSAIADYLRDFCGVSIIKIENDSNSYQAYLNDVATFGYYYNTEFENIDNLLSSNSEFKITCHCEIENVPRIASQSIKARLGAGVKFVLPTN